MKAQNKTEFVKVWNIHIDHLGLLCYSLPNEFIKDFGKLLEQLKSYVEIASKNTYGDKTK